MLRDVIVAIALRLFDFTYWKALSASRTPRPFDAISADVTHWSALTIFAVHRARTNRLAGGSNFPLDDATIGSGASPSSVGRAQGSGSCFSVG